MTFLDLARYRLSNQQIVKPKHQNPSDLVAWMGGIQAQDYLGALWAIGLRLPKATEPESERAAAERNRERDEMLAELAHRYFVSHGPATVQDFAW